MLFGEVDTSYPDHNVKGALKGGLVGFWSLRGAFWPKLYKTVAGHPQLSGNGSPVWTPNPDLEGPGPLCFWSHGASLSRRVYNTKVVVNVPNSAWPQEQANVWLSKHTLQIKINLILSIVFLIPI